MIFKVSVLILRIQYPHSTRALSGGGNQRKGYMYNLLNLKKRENANLCLHISGLTLDRMDTKTSL